MSNLRATRQHQHEVYYGKTYPGEHSVHLGTSLLLQTSPGAQEHYCNMRVLSRYLSSIVEPKVARSQARLSECGRMTAADGQGASGSGIKLPLMRLGPLWG